MIRNLTEQQYRAIELLLEGKTQIETAEALGVHRNTVGNWVRSDHFNTEYIAAVKRLSHSRLPAVVNAIIDGAVNGKSAAMAKLVLQMNGMLTDKLEVDNKGTTGVIHTDIDAMKAEIERFRAERQE